MDKQTTIYELMQNGNHALAEGEWPQFLRSAAWNFRFKFPAQVMIYAQRPEATACYTFDEWTKRFNRRIRRGAKGIALLDDRKAQLSMSYVFDYKDTYSPEGTHLSSWQLTPQNEPVVRDVLIQEFMPDEPGVEADMDRLSFYSSAVAMILEDKIAETLPDLIAARPNCRLSEVGEGEAENIYRMLLLNSATALIMHRCGFDSEIPDAEFADAAYFNTTESMSILGNATQSLGMQILRVMAKTVAAWDKEQQKEEEKEHEDEHHVHPDRGVSDSEPEHSEQPRAEQIQQNETEISEGEQGESVHRPFDERPADVSPGADGADRPAAGGRDDDQSHDEEPAAEQSEGEPAVGTAHGDAEETGRGPGSERDSVRLNQFGDSEIEQALIRMGPSVEGGKYRIQRAVEKENDLPKMLRDEYGTGGASILFQPYEASGFISYDAKGFHMRAEGFHPLSLTWNAVASRIQNYVNEDRYLDEQEKIQYERYFAEQEALRGRQELGEVIRAFYGIHGLRDHDSIRQYEEEVRAFVYENSKTARVNLLKRMGALADAPGVMGDPIALNTLNETLNALGDDGRSEFQSEIISGTDLGIVNPFPSEQEVEEIAQQQEQPLARESVMGMPEIPEAPAEVAEAEPSNIPEEIFGEGEVLTLAGIEYMVLHAGDEFVTLQDIEHPLFTQEMPVSVLRTLLDNAREQAEEAVSLYIEENRDNSSTQTAVKDSGITENQLPSGYEYPATLIRNNIVQSLRNDYDALQRTSHDSDLPDSEEFGIILGDFSNQTNKYAGKTLTAKEEGELRTADYNLKALAAVAYRMKNSPIEGIANTGTEVIDLCCILCQVDEPALYELAKASDWLSAEPPAPEPIQTPIPEPAPEQKAEKSKVRRPGAAAARKTFKHMESLVPYIMDGTLDHVHMESDGFEPLYVERIAEDQIAIAHTFEQNGDLMVDPEIVFFVDYEAQEMYPVSIQQPIFGGRISYVYEPDDKDYLFPDIAESRDITSFFHTWRRNLEWQGHEPKYGSKFFNIEGREEYIFENGKPVLKPEEPELRDDAGRAVLEQLMEHFNRWKNSDGVQIHGLHYDEILARMSRIQPSDNAEENRQNILYAAYTIRRFFPRPDNLTERARATSRILGMAEDHLDLVSNLNDMGNVLRLREWKEGADFALFMDLSYLCSKYHENEIPEQLRSFVDKGSVLTMRGEDYKVVGADHEAVNETLVYLNKVSDNELDIVPIGLVYDLLYHGGAPDYYEAIPALANFLNTHNRPDEIPAEMQHSVDQLILAGLEYENDRSALYPERRQAEREQEQKSVRTVRDAYNEFLPLVRDRVMQDQAFVNALRNADDENLEVEGKAAIQRAVLEIGNLELTKFYFDMVKFHNMMHIDIMKDAVNSPLRGATHDSDRSGQLEQWKTGGEQALLADMIHLVQDNYNPRPNLFDLGYTNNQQDSAEQIEAIYQFLTKNPPNQSDAAYDAVMQNAEQYRKDRSDLYPGRDFSQVYPIPAHDHPELDADRHFDHSRGDKETLADLLEFVNDYRIPFKNNTPALSEHDQAAYEAATAFVTGIVVTDSVTGNMDNIQNVVNYINVWFIPFSGGMDAEFMDNVDIMLEKAQSLDAGALMAQRDQQGAYLLDNGTYLYLQTSDEGYDYTLYDSNFKDLDGGQLDAPELSFLDARNEILEMHNLLSHGISELPAEEFEQMLSDAEQKGMSPSEPASEPVKALYDESSFHEGDFYKDDNGGGIITGVYVPDEDSPHKATFSYVDPDAPEDSREGKGYVMSMSVAIQRLNRGEATLTSEHKQEKASTKEKVEDEPTLFDFEFDAPVEPAPEPEPAKPLSVQAAQGIVHEQERINCKLPADTISLGGPKARYQSNVAAIRLLKDLEGEGRLATEQEQAVLAKYVGWGGIPDAFDKDNKSWSNEYEELKGLLTEEEYIAARESTLTAFYTPPEVTSAIYQVLGNLGFQRGNILDPGCGTGSFSGRLPEEMSQSKVYGIEKDSISGRIAQQLYQKNNIAIEGYENTKLPDNFFDVAVGNVPFGNFKVLDRRYDKLNLPIHDYFFAKTLDKVRPGGVIAFVTSMGTMDKQSTDFRRYLAQRADLLGAIRLPNDTFKTNAGTDVTSDIIFLQKREFPRVDEPDWVYLERPYNYETHDWGAEINSYFATNPEMVLGEMKEISGPHGPELACIAREGQNLKEELANAIQNIYGSIKEAEQGLYDQEYEQRESIPADPDVRNFSYTLVGDDIYFREDSEMFKVETSKKGEERIRGLIGLRDIVHDLIDAQVNGHTDEEIRSIQRKLNDAYDTFSAKHGLINSRGNDMAFSDDSSYYLLCSLEHVNDKGEFLGKADMFYKRTIHAHEVVDHVDTAQEALAVSLGERGRIDFALMTRLSGLSKEELTEQLQDQIFQDPTHPGAYEIGALYLSGNVREKLEQAKAAEAEEPGKWGANIRALLGVQPQDLEPADIVARLGSTWIPKEDYTQFMHELLEPSYWTRERMKVLYNPYANIFSITNINWDDYNAKANTTYGTRRMSAYKIIENTLNLKDVKVFDTITDRDGNQRRVLNENETMEAQEKQQLIKDAFREWLWQDPDRTERLCKSYNERFNSYVPPKFNGNMVQFHNLNPNVSMRPWQRDAVARIMYNGNTLLAHAVGAGKTWTMSAAAMEMKYLGLCNKSLIVVPNHLVGQWASAIYDQYPNAKVLASTKKDFETKNRKKFCSRIATGDYDVVVIGHSQFERIPLSKERQEAGIREEIDKVLDGIAALKAEKAEHFTIKQMERMKKSLELRLEKLNNSKRRDDVITFEQLGVDRLFVDESHEYKNLFLYTKMQNVAGISQTDSQKASDMYLKCRYINELTGNKGNIHATGTPLSNTMAELYATQRYLQHDLLNAMDLGTFDQWASTFGETVTSVELAPEGTGYRARTRFANFFNIPELMSLYCQVADIQTADMLDLPLPIPHYETVVVPASDIQLACVQELGERATKIRNGGVKPEEDNMLCITNDGRKLALDQRLINPDWPDNPDSKVNACADNILRIWNESAATKGTQLVFCDISTPNNKTFNVYDDLKQKLVSRGIPEHEIRFIHEANTDAQKEALFQKVRDGEVRVLMGSTGKMGTGTNVQERLVAGHDLDCPWRPSDLEQRAGRVVRQGNTNQDVYMYRYVTEGTFDAYMYQLVENKQRFISQIYTSKPVSRQASDVDEIVMSFAEIKALASGNPLIKERVEVEGDVQRLQLLKSRHENAQIRLKHRVTKYLPEEINKVKANIAALETDFAFVNSRPKRTEDNHLLPITIKGCTYEQAKEGGEALRNAIKRAPKDAVTPVGSLRGFTLSVDNTRRAWGDYSPHLQLSGPGSKYIEFVSDSAIGNVIRLNNILDKDIPEKLDRTKKELADLQHELEVSTKELDKPFTREAELAEKVARLAELTRQLDLDAQESSRHEPEKEQEPEQESRGEGKRSLDSIIRSASVRQAAQFNAQNGHDEFETQRYC